MNRIAHFALRCKQAIANSIPFACATCTNGRNNLIRPDAAAGGHKRRKL
jgi:hypothetical protein